MSRIVRVFSVDSGLLGVQLEQSHARHLLRSSTPGASQMEVALRSALEDRSMLAITSSDAHDIVDVRSADPAWEEPPRPPEPRPTGIVERTIGLWKGALDYMMWYLSPISYAQAVDAFNAVSAVSCDPLSVPPPCIPFLYPDNGCWARAHGMRRIIARQSIMVRKIWIDGTLDVDARNSPGCMVHWMWHCAPIVRVEKTSIWIIGTIGAHTSVLDPALFSGPVPEQTWRTALNDPNAVVRYTNGDVFYKGGGPDPAYVATDSTLAQYRLMLKLRAAHAGPPPYATCN